MGSIAIQRVVNLNEVNKWPLWHDCQTKKQDIDSEEAKSRFQPLSMTFFSGSKEELVRFIIQSVGVTAIEYDTNRFQPLSMTFIFWWLKKERFGLLLRFTCIYHRLGMTSLLALTVNWLGSLYRKWLSLCSHYDTYDFG